MRLKGVAVDCLSLLEYKSQTGLARLDCFVLRCILSTKCSAWHRLDALEVGVKELTKVMMLLTVIIIITIITTLRSFQSRA